jgi:dTDP-4-dehydrorhamnose reductase
MFMRILITGANGQLGTALQTQLFEHELFTADLPDIDITNKDQIVDEVTQYRPDVVIHCAAYTDVDGAALNPDLAYRVNGLGTQNVALACLKAGADMVHISTNEVFAGDRPDGYEEWMPVTPINPYARSKAAAEFMVRGILSKYYVVRTAWLYAKGGHNFIHAILNSAREGDKLRIVADDLENMSQIVIDDAQIAGRQLGMRQAGVKKGRRGRDKCERRHQVIKLHGHCLAVFFQYGEAHGNPHPKGLRGLDQLLLAPDQIAFI